MSTRSKPKPEVADVESTDEVVFTCAEVAGILGIASRAGVFVVKRLLAMSTDEIRRLTWQPASSISWGQAWATVSRESVLTEAGAIRLLAERIASRLGFGGAEALKFSYHVGLAAIARLDAGLVNKAVGGPQLTPAARAACLEPWRDVFGD